MSGETRYQPKWLVIEDPSGDFTGARFDYSDLRYTALFGYWPAGIAWQHTETKRIAHYANYKIVIEKPRKEKEGLIDNTHCSL